MSDSPVPASEGFIPFCHVEFFHEYLSGGAFSELAFVPTPSTATAIKRLGLLQRQVGNRLTLLFHSANPPSPAQAQDSSLIFGLEFPNSSFGTFSDLPLKDGFTLLLTPQVKPSSSSSLTVNEIISEADFAQITSLQISLPDEAASSRNSASAFTLQTASGETVVPSKSSGGTHSMADVTAYGSGVYRLYKGEGCVGTFLAEPAFSMKRPAAALCLHGSQFSFEVGAARTSAPTFSVTIPTRKTVWRFDVFPQSTDRTATFSVSAHLDDSSNGTSSDKPALQQAPSFHPLKEGLSGPKDQKSLAFESDLAHPIPMRARPEHRFQLLRNGEVYVQNLGTPAANFCRASDGKTLCSQMIIYT